MSFFGDVIGGKAADRASQFNAGLLKRDALIAEQEAKAGFAVYTNYDLPRFNDNADKLIGEIITNFATSGVERSGTVLDVLFEIAESGITPAEKLIYEHVDKNNNCSDKIFINNSY